MITCEFHGCEPRYCDHCSAEIATVDLGYLWYCQTCFDEAADGYAQWFEQMRVEEKNKKAQQPNP